MGEDVHLHGIKKRAIRDTRLTLKEGSSPFARQLEANRNRVRKHALEAMKKLLGTTVSMKGKRKDVEVLIDRKSVNHIANDISMERVRIKVEDAGNLPAIMSNAVQVGISMVDKEGIHSKKARRIKDYRYYSFEYNGTTMYANTESIQRTVNGKTVRRERLHAITEKLKSQGE